MVNRYRDIQLIEKDDSTYLAIACDVSAGIGPREGDTVDLSYALAGYYAAAVPLIELISIGATPMSIANTLSVEMVPSGEKVIEGIKEVMALAGIDESHLTGSTEDNMITSLTSIGVTIIGEIAKLKIDQLRPHVGEYVYLVGYPKMGQQFLQEEVHGHKGEVIDVEAVKGLREAGFVGHMLPIGSKGVAYELSMLLETATYGIGDKGYVDIALSEDAYANIDEHASAGPATCLLLCCDRQEEEVLRHLVKQPITRLGQLTRSNKGIDKLEA